MLILATDYFALAFTSVGRSRLLAISGGVLIFTACIAVAAGTARLTIPLAALGAVPLAATTWWSIVTPTLAVVTIAVAATVTHQGTATRRCLSGSPATHTVATSEEAQSTSTGTAPSRRC
jgi:hypothetical protein